MTQHTEYSSYREKLVEHLFVGELLKHLWFRHKCSLEVANPEVDNAGYDLIAEAGGVLRHIQLKASVTARNHLRTVNDKDGMPTMLPHKAEASGQ